MPVTRRMELHVASNIGELNKMAEVDKKIGNSNARIYIKSADKVYSTANDLYLSGDEEKAYIMYMKYFNVISLVKKSSDYKKQQKYYNELITPASCKVAIARAEELAKSLKERYDLQNDINVRSKNDSLPKAASPLPSVPGHKPQEKSDAPKDSKTVKNDVKKSGEFENKVEFEDVPNGAVSAKRVYDWLRPTKSLNKSKSAKSDQTVLLIDVRPADQFEDSRILSPNVINIPGDIIPPGKLIKHFQAQIPDSAKPLWSKRAEFTNIVLFDWKSNIDDVKPGTPICSLKDAMYKWDSSTTLKSEPLVLEGGYETWLFFYPTVTTNARPKIVQEVKAADKVSRSPSLNFEYPDFDEVFTEKPEPVRAQIPGHVVGSASAKDISPAERFRTKRAMSYDETNLEKFIGAPSVDRSLKPRSMSVSVSDDRPPDVDKLRREMQDLKIAREQKILEFENEEREFEKKVREREERVNALKVEEKRLLDLQKITAKEKKDLADLMREKRRVEEEMKRENQKLEAEKRKKVEEEKSKQAVLAKLAEEEAQIKEEVERSPVSSKEATPEVSRATKPKSRGDEPRDEYVEMRRKPRGEDPRDEYVPKPKVLSQKSRDEPSPSRSTTKLKDEPEGSSNLGMRRSSSTPNIARMVAEFVRDNVPPPGEQAPPAPVPQPSVDRGSKPRPPDGRRQSFSDFHASRLMTMQPQYGNVDAGLTGLRNLGNTCYMNSILQCLNNTTPLVTYCLTGNYKLHINRQNFLGHGGEIPEEMAIVVRALWSGKYTNFSAVDFKRTIGKHNTQFAGYGQQDSQEFLLFLLDGLHEDLNMIVERPKIAPQENDNISDYRAAELAWSNHKLLNESIIVELFQGQYKSTLKCLHCGKESVTFDTFMYLSLPIPSHNRCTLHECIQCFLKEEKMSGGSKWFCPRCKQRREALKKIDLWKLPTILLIHLKRFSSQGAFGQKLNTQVSFPLSNLNMRDYIKGTRVRPDYHLYAVSNHYGTMQGGHYTAYCKNPNTKKWNKFDDSDVTPMSENDVKTSAAYILFYSSIDMVPPV